MNGLANILPTFAILYCWNRRAMMAMGLSYVGPVIKNDIKILTVPLGLSLIVLTCLHYRRRQQSARQ